MPGQFYILINLNTHVTIMLLKSSNFFFFFFLPQKVSCALCQLGFIPYRQPLFLCIIIFSLVLKFHVSRIIQYLFFGSWLILLDMNILNITLFMLYVSIVHSLWLNGVHFIAPPQCDWLWVFGLFPVFVYCKWACYKYFTSLWPTYVLISFG
jgi:hypothetical protein